MLEKYKGKLVRHKETSLNKEVQLPKLLTALGKDAFILKANIKGRTTWTNRNLLHNVPIHKILRDIKDDLKDRDFRVYIQLVQHHDVQVLG